jgi:hypothetical protein
MLDLFLSSLVNIAQVQIVAQSQATTVYLPITTTQSTRQNCVTYTVTNLTDRAVREVNVNRRNSQGKIYQSYLTSYLDDGKKFAFDMCDNSFVNVEARQ